MRDTLGTEMSMPGGAQAGRSIDVSNSRHGEAAMFMASVRAEATDRPPGGRGETENSDPFLVTDQWHVRPRCPADTCARPVRRPALPGTRSARRSREGGGRRAGPAGVARGGLYLGAPTSFPSGDTAYQVPPTP
ncbi:hypothetical protein GCM10023237_05480 [Streptomyces coeruleoprunus]